MSSASKQYLTVTGLVCVLALISFLLFYYGRQHKVIIDNRAVETADGQRFRALPGALVAVDHKVLGTVGEDAPPPSAPPLISFRFWPPPDQSLAKAVEMMPRERIMVKVLGPSFNLKAEVRNQFGEPEKTVDVDIKLGVKRDAMVRLVKLAGGLPEALEEFPNDSLPRTDESTDQPRSSDEGGAPPDVSQPAL